MSNRDYSSRTIKIKTQTIIDQKAGLVKDTVIFNNAAPTPLQKKNSIRKNILPSLLPSKKSCNLCKISAKKSKSRTAKIFERLKALTKIFCTRFIASVSVISASPESANLSVYIKEKMPSQRKADFLQRLLPAICLKT